MLKYFGIKFEFDRKIFNEIVKSHIENKQPGYICVVDGNNFSAAQKDPKHMNVLNNAITNDCDSTWLAKITNLIHGTNFKHMNGPDLFLEYIKKSEFRHLFLGASKNVLYGLKDQIVTYNPAISNMLFIELPFRKVEEFDYKGIAEIINKDSSDIIWVSLGAPKQEQFMYNLKPYLKQGVMIGVGAAFNFYSGLDDAPKRAPKWIRRCGMEWVYRIFSEPQKQIKRNYNFLCSLPSAIRQEIKEKKRQEKQNY